METKEIGPYAILENLGKGGMGEVYLAKDPSSGRSVALKRIRPELKSNKTIQSRFLREATVASFLSHPSIVPILSIEATPPDIYYTMPFVEGETLRQILKKIREGDGNWSIPSLTRLFLQVCEAVAYTHSKGILHRDLKPENIIVGKYGEVMILDWGIADFIDQIEKDEPFPHNIPGSEDLTRPGKIAGTLAYMAPERLTGKSSSVQTDIYALGIILYQLLTLELPFQRKTIAAFRKQAAKEELIDPTEMAPYRDVPHQLATVCRKCLAKSEKERYQLVEELIADLKNYIEGRPEWIFLGKLDLNRKEDWQFQENILPAKHIAITRNLDVTEWVALMISQRSFSENVRFTAEVEVGKSCQGIGFLFCLPGSDERKSLEEGYCLWISSKTSSQLFRNNVQILELPGVFFTPGKKNRVQIEKSGDQLKFLFDEEAKLNFTSHLPLAGKHIGFLHKDGDFTVKNIRIYDGSHNVMVNCLAVPNAFLSHKLYDFALQEYRRIAQCFPGRMEGREALFRAGLALLEKGRAQKNPNLFQLALKEFEKLYRTPGAPLEYLGKSLVYDAVNDSEEEAKCLELALRKFPKHPLLPMLKEHIHYRMHESSLNNRQAAYRIILLALRNLPDLFEHGETRALLESLQHHREALPFMEKTSHKRTQMAIELAFWLEKPPILAEIAHQILKKEPLDEPLLGNALFSLQALEATSELEPFLSLPYRRVEALKLASQSLPHLAFPKQVGKPEYRSLQLLLQNSLLDHIDSTLKTLDRLKRSRLPKEDRIACDALEIWCYLLQHRPSLAGAVLRKYATAALTQEASPLHFPYGAWLYVTKGPKAASLHFSSVLETPSPPTTSLPSHFLAGYLDERKDYFTWEKRELNRQLKLFYRVIGKKRDCVTLDL